MSAAPTPPTPVSPASRLNPDAEFGPMLAELDAIAALRRADQPDPNARFARMLTDGSSEQLSTEDYAPFLLSLGVPDDKIAAEAAEIERAASELLARHAGTVR